MHFVGIIIRVCMHAMTERTYIYICIYICIYLLLMFVYLFLHAENEEWGPFFKGELGRLEEWLQQQQINHPDFNTFRLNSNKR